MKTLMKNETQILRILKQEGKQVLVIDCVKQTMPKWIRLEELNGFVDMSEAELHEAMDMDISRELNAKEKRIAQERFTLIAPILPHIGDVSQRCYLIDEISGTKSKQIIRKYLCLYLIYQDISVLAPAKRKEKVLTKDEKNIRWSLNKFFYTSHKNSLKTAYTMMLKEKYCDAKGKLLEKYPTFYQYRYCYRTHKNMQQFFISRNSMSDYQRNKRPLLGGGVHEFAQLVGVGMLDSTVCDIYLVDEAGMVVGRPILTVCIDAYSSLCMGYCLTWEGGIYSIRQLMVQVVSDKTEWCKNHGVFIKEEQWCSSQMPAVLVTDMGTEYTSDTFAQITELGVKLVNLPPYRPNLKGSVEKFFDVVQGLYKNQLKGKGVIETDYMERGAHDYRKDACLTMKEFEQIILHCIIYYNSKRVISNFPYTQEMMQEQIKPYASAIFMWGRKQLGANLMDADAKTLVQVLLPRAVAKFSRRGLMVNSLRYKNPKYQEAYLKGKEGTAAYNPEDVSKVWLMENGEYIPFDLIETRFMGKTLEAVQSFQKDKKQMMNGVEKESQQAQVDLMEHIQVIADQKKHTDVKLKEIQKTKRKEQVKQHKDFTKEV